MTVLLSTLALLAPSAGDPAAGDSAARRHPSEAVLYLEVPDVPAALEAYGRTALVRTLRDPELHAALGEVLGEPEVDPLAFLEKQYRSAVERGDLPPLKELVLDPLRGVSLSVAAPGGRIGALLRAAVRDSVEPGDLLARLGLQLELELANPAAAARLLEQVEDRVAASGEGPEGGLVWEERGTARVARPAAGGPSAPPLALVQDGPRVCLLLGTADPGAYLARARGEEPGLALSDPEPFTGEGTTVLRYRATFPQEVLALRELQGSAPLVDVLEGLFGPPVGMLARGGTWRVGIDATGRVITEGLHPRPEGPFAGMFASAPLPDGALDLVHPEAIVGWAVHFDEEPLLAWIEHGLEGREGDPLAELDRRFGFRPDRDLLDPLGPALAYSLPEPKTLLAAPPLMVAAALESAEDRAAFQRGMDGLVRFVHDAAGDRLAVSVSEYRGMRLYSIRLDWDALGAAPEIPIELSAFFRPTLAVCDDRVFLTTLPSHAKREIRRVSSGDSGGAVTHGFPPGCTAVGFSDWLRFLGKLYTSARVIGSLAGVEAPGNLRALPPAELLLKRFEPSRRWKRLHGEDAVQQYQESSFGPELLLGAALGAFLARASAELTPAPPPPPPNLEQEGTESREAARAEVERLRGAALAFRTHEGRWPGDLDDLTRPAPGLPHGHLGGELPAADPWGGAYHLAVVESNAVVWCDGPNGLDEEGAGDDVVAR